MNSETKRQIIRYGGAAAAVGLGAYALHYYNRVAKPPELFYNDNDENKRIIEGCPSLKHTYFPTFWASNKHLSTVLVMLRPLPHLELKREVLKLPDGGCIALDWVKDDHQFGVAPSNSPTLLVLHGLNGGSDANYVRQLVKIAKKRLFKVKNIHLNAVIMNNRGVAGSELLTAKSYCGAYTEDLRYVIKHIKGKINRNSELIAVGYSLGANILVKYLGEEGENTPLRAAVSVSNPFDFIGSMKILEKRTVYNRVLTAGCVRNFTAQQHVFKERDDIDHDIVKQSKKLYDFDNHFTRKIFGYDSVEDYYRDASSNKYLADVKTPLLIIHAWDDPIVDKDAIPLDVIKANPHIILASFERGGHVGFPSGFFFPFLSAECWADKVISEYIGSLLSHQHSTSPSVSSMPRQHEPMKARL